MIQCVIYIILAIIELTGMALSGNDYGIESTDYRIQYLADNQAVFDNLADHVLENGKGHGTIRRVNGLQTERKDYKKVDKQIEPVIEAHYDDNGDEFYAVFDLYGKTEGFAECHYIYVANDVKAMLDKRFFNNARWDDEQECYVVYNASSYSEIIPVNEHWLFWQVAYYDNSGFKREE